MRCDLEHAVRRGIDDQSSRFDVLLAVIANDVGARIRLVAEHPSARCRFKGGDDLVGKAVGIGGERLLGHEPRDLPVADGSILAGRQLAHTGIGGHGCIDTATDPLNVEKS